MQMPTNRWSVFKRWVSLHTMIQHICHTLETGLESERHRWVLWIPVALGMGIAWYFSLHKEPVISFSWRIVWVMGLLTVMTVGWVTRLCIIGWISWGLFWAGLGFFLALLRTEHINPHPINQSTGPLWISGVIEGLDHPASTSTLFQRIILRIDHSPHLSESSNNHRPGARRTFSNPPAQTDTVSLPKKAMITIRTACVPLLEGDHIRLKAVLTPLPGPCFPGAHDPARQFFFQGIGASGFAITGARILSRNPTLLSQWRHGITRKIHGFLPPPLGAVACGLVTGDKIALPQNVRQEFSDSGLSHLLAIAGLHMSMLSGLCFMIFQRTLACIPRLVLYVNLDRIAALLSLGVGWLYLMISGQRYPVQRAFFMMAATMLSMIVGRRRHSMRILMLCAATFLILQPESLLSLSFQLSFAAVGGLIAVYEWRMQNRYNAPWKPRRRKIPKFLLKAKRFFTDSLWSSGSITVITLPIMVHHFYHISLQGMISNMIAIPFTGIVIMPMGIMALVFLNTPFASTMMDIWGLSLRGLMHIAAYSARYGSWMIGWFRPHDSIFFAIEMLGICWLLLWQRPMRWWGLYVWIGAMIMGHAYRTEPLFFIDVNHKVVAFVDRDQNTLWVSSLRRGKWATTRWSQAFGAPNVALWPSTTECIKIQKPWYNLVEKAISKNERGLWRAKKNTDWSLTLGWNTNEIFNHIFSNPYTECIMLDCNGKMMGQTEQRPWSMGAHTAKETLVAHKR
ncbi:MAG: ComEC family competence protein [Alphaproteobacteria bacterium]|nr:ComEC family competence protein [Alphaproteobacteria bacterium]